MSERLKHKPIGRSGKAPPNRRIETDRWASASATLDRLQRVASCHSGKLKAAVVRCKTSTILK